jgi:hypothetical protein
LLSGTTSPARYDASPRRLGSRVHPEPAGARAADRGPAVTQRAESAGVGRPWIQESRRLADARPQSTHTR